MSREALILGTDLRPPVLFQGSYSTWKARFRDFLRRQINGQNLLISITEGNAIFYITSAVGADGAPATTLVIKREDQYTAAERTRATADLDAKSFLMQALPDEIYASVDSYETAKEMWDEVKKIMQGTKLGTNLKITSVITAYEQFKAKTTEDLPSIYSRFIKVINELKKNHIRKSNLEVNIKFLHCLQPEWKRFTSIIQQHRDLQEVDVHTLYESLRLNEEDVQQAIEEKQISVKTTADHLAMVASKSAKSSSSKSKSKKSKSPVSSEEESGFKSDSDEEELERAFQALFNKRNQQNFYRTPSNNNQRFSSSSRRQESKTPDSETKEKYDKIDMENIICHRCSKRGHYARDCKAKIVKDSNYYKTKMLLSKAKEAGKVMMSDDDHWLELTDNEDEEATAHIVFMAKTLPGEHTNDEEKNSDTVDSSTEVNDGF
ncbi:MAG TPA: hypothetical protein VIJ14_10505, partial [Rhabdochlamydiaceae bacterium]